MASNKTLKKFCKLSKYIEQSDPNFFEVFDDLCIMHLLKPARGASGITLLYPKEKAYRQKIINAAYSTDPETAVNMIKSLILQDYYPNLASFGSKAVNLLNQKLQVESASDKAIKLTGGLELTPEAKFVPMYRDNMAVYILSGKGELPLNGPTVSHEHKTAKMGGGLFGSNKAALQKILADTYVGEIGKTDNIYVKKVYLQLKCLAESKAENIQHYLGNDEFSDSYLLDMYCEKYHPDCFKSLIECLTPNAYDVINNITKERYITMKESFCGVGKNAADIKDPNRLDNINSPMEIRMRVCKLYGDDKERMGKDLFIVFANICKDLWLTDTDAIGAFKNFTYLAGNVYTKCGDMVKQEFDIPRDLTLYGNLLKSDVFHYVPQASFTSDDNLPIPDQLPSPLDMSLYSLCGFVNKPSATTGGATDPTIAYLLGDL
jgi:hypothetical protein